MGKGFASEWFHSVGHVSNVPVAFVARWKRAPHLTEVDLSFSKVPIDPNILRSFS